MSVVLGTGEHRYRVVENWAKLPDRWEFRDVAAVACDSKDRVYVFNRGEHPMMVFDRDGNFLRSWGEGLFSRAHGIHIDGDDNLYCTDDGDHTVRKISTDGKVLMTIGVPNEPAPFLSGKPFLQIPLQQLLPVLTLILPVQFIVIRLNGYGQDCRQLHHPLSSARTSQSHQVEIGGINHSSIIHPHPRQATADVGNHGEQQNIPLALVADVRQTTLQKVGQTVEQLIWKTLNIAAQFVSLKFLYFSFLTPFDGIRIPPK